MVVVTILTARLTVLNLTITQTSSIRFPRQLPINVSTDRLKWRPMPDKMTGKLFTSNIASARNQWYSKDSVFQLAQMTLYVKV